MSFVNESGGRSRLWWGAAAAIGVAVISWYLWPATGNGTSDVVAFGSADFADVQRPLAEQIRDRGRGYTWLGDADTWCDAASLLRISPLDSSIDTVVISVGSDGTCSPDGEREVMDLLDQQGVDGLFVALPDERAPDGDQWEVVTTVDLLGTGDVIERPCEWWNDCPPSGLVEVRSAPGRLNDEGNERVARMVAAIIG